MPRLIRIVLVEPREAGNVGAAARAMKNFGVTDLAIVGEAPQLAPVAEWWASGAEDVVNQATKFATLNEALADAAITVATTSSRERHEQTILTPAEVRDLYATLPENATIALVFGREDRGLTAEEIDGCQRRATIPTSGAFPTMNLAQSVAVFCYELSKQREFRSGKARPSAEMVERFHERTQEMLEEIGFLHENNPDRIYRDLRDLLGRADPDERELTILLGILRQLDWKLRRGAE